MTGFDPHVVGRILVLENEQIRATVLPDQGADLASLIDQRTGHELLFQAPGGRRDRRWLPPYEDSQSNWMAAYGGGWQVLCPNAGAETNGPGVRWGYHGEACLLAWTVLRAAPRAAELEVRLSTAPLHLRRRISLQNEAIRVEEELTNESEAGIEVMWVQHPAFGQPLIGPGARLETAARLIRTDSELAGDTLAAGRQWPWPVAADRRGRPVDLRELPGPLQRRALLAYLENFDRHEVAIVNQRLDLRVTLRWSGEAWPSAWLWQEVHATKHYPWFGRAHVVAIEPASTVPAWGAQRARQHGGSLLYLGARACRTSWIELEASSIEAHGGTSAAAPARTSPPFTSSRSGRDE